MPPQTPGEWPRLIATRGTLWNSSLNGMRKHGMTAFGLVLGGGGPIGAAWYAGLASGLADEGLDLGLAHVIIGTSAGAWAGAWLASERSGAFVDAMDRLGAAPEPLGMDIDLIGQVCSLMGRAEAPLEPPDTRRIGELALQVPPVVVRFYAKHLPGSDWPERFRALVVHIQTGELRMLGRADGLPLEVGVAASCAAAGVAAPVALPDGLYMDGGARSATNADTLVGHPVTKAIVASPVPPDVPMIGAAVERVLQEECRRLSTAGIRFETILPTAVEKEAFGHDLLNYSKMRAAIEAGKTRAKSETTRLRELIEG
jgi:NTE family protein